MTTLRAGGASDVGRVRAINEDSFLIADGLYAVADGVGGHQAGEVASATAVEALAVEFTTATRDGLVDAFQAANEAVWTLAQESVERRGMGTTLTALALVEGEDGDDQLVLANVGDSRGYLFQGGELVQITDDHSLVGELVREGQITEAEARVHPRRSIITRALGMDARIEIDTWTVDPSTGDRLVLCSDGLTNEVSDDRIAATLRRLGDPQDCAGELVRLARANGGNDNITVVVVEVLDDSGRRAADSAAARGTAGARRSVVHDTGPVEADELFGDRSTPDSSSAGSIPREAPAPEGSPAAPGVGPRRLTWRVAAFAVVALAILGLGAVAMVWYARSSYFVGLDGDQVAIYKGRPGGLLWFDPTVEQVTDLTVDQVAPARRAELRQGKTRASLDAAEAFVVRIAEEGERLGLADPEPEPEGARPPTTSTVPAGTGGAP